METQKIPFTLSPSAKFGLLWLVLYPLLSAGSIWFGMDLSGTWKRILFALAGLFLLGFVFTLKDLLNLQKQKQIIEEHLRDEHKIITMTAIDFTFPAIHGEEIVMFTVPYGAIDKVYHNNDGDESIIVYTDCTAEEYEKNKEKFGEESRFEWSIDDFNSEEDAHTFEQILRHHRES